MIPMVIDCDGVLTDCTVGYPSMERRFNLRDGHGISLLKQRTSIEPVIMTGESDKSITLRASKLEVRCYTGIKNKLAALLRLHHYSEVDFSNGYIAIGDDIQDISLLDNATLAFCPADAHDDVKKVDGIIVLEKRGGEGCVREAIDMILTQPWIQLLFKGALRIE